jgi:transposase-like protein
MGKERQSYRCSILENGRIKNCGNVESLAKHLKVDPQKMRRWRRKLFNDKKPLVKYYEGILIDFEPEQL